ncbi:unnamed protein product, partial [Porites evermanni]
YIFSTNNTCNLDVVGKSLSCIKEKLGIKMLAFKNHFSLSDTTEMCESIIPDLPMDFAMFVVHANEDRFLINEDSARIYRALLKATGGKVLVVIGGDDNYRDSAEEQGSLLSRWARRKVSSQFSEEYLDGRQSFIFSWDDGHRPIHEEALLHYFDPHKKEKKFVPEKKTEVANTQVLPKQEEDEHRDESNVPFEDFEEITHADVPEDSMQTTEPKRAREEEMESIAILIRDESDINTIMKGVFGDVLPGINTITSRDPCDMKVLLQNTPVRSCFIIVESTKIKEESLTKSSSTVYQDLLKTAKRIVGKNI